MTGYSEISPERPTAEVWSIPRRVWFVLMSWGVAILAIMGLFAFWAWRIDKDQDREQDDKRDQAMCEMMDTLLAAPDAVDQNEAAERSRISRAAIRHYQDVIGCQRFD